MKTIVASLTLHNIKKTNSISVLFWFEWFCSHQAAECDIIIWFKLGGSPNRSIGEKIEVSTYFLTVLSFIYDSVLHLDSSLFISGAHGPILEMSLLKNDKRLILSILSKACEKFRGQAVRLRSPRPWIPERPARSKNRILI